MSYWCFIKVVIPNHKPWIYVVSELSILDNTLGDTANSCRCDARVCEWRDKFFFHSHNIGCLPSKDNDGRKYLRKSALPCPMLLWSDYDNYQRTKINNRYLRTMGHIITNFFAGSDGPPKLVRLKLYILETSCCYWSCNKYLVYSWAQSQGCGLSGQTGTAPTNQRKWYTNKYNPTN